MMSIFMLTVRDTANNILAKNEEKSKVNKNNCYVKGEKQQYFC